MEVDLKLSAANIILGFLVHESWHVIELVTISSLDCFSVKEKGKEATIMLLSSQPSTICRSPKPSNTVTDSHLAGGLI